MASFHVLAGPDTTDTHPAVRRIGVSDLFAAIDEGLHDFWVRPSHYVFLCLIYPIVGVVLALWSSGNNTWPLLYPLMSGFALIGPFAALPLYEVSRRQELGLETSWRDAFGVLRSPSLPAIGALGVMLLVIFTLWLATAQALYESVFGNIAPMSLTGLLTEIFTTDRGRTLILLGNAIGFVFALVTLATTVIAFPLLLDRDVGAMVAVETSIRAVAANPLPMAVWGLLVAGLLVLGSLPIFVGLAVVIPVLGHATWRLYRKVVVPGGPTIGH